jgi:hypothetical protein
MEKSDPGWKNSDTGSGKNITDPRQLCFGLPDPPFFAQIILILGFF